MALPVDVLAIIAEFSLSSDYLYTWTCVSRTMARLVSRTYLRRTGLVIKNQSIEVRAYATCKVLAVWRRSHLYLPKHSLTYKFKHNDFLCDEPWPSRRLELQNLDFALRHFAISLFNSSQPPSFRSIRMFNLTNLSVVQVVELIGTMGDAGCENILIDIQQIVAARKSSCLERRRRVASIKTLSIVYHGKRTNLHHILQSLELPSLEAFDFWVADSFAARVSCRDSLEQASRNRWSNAPSDTFWKRHPHVKLGFYSINHPPRDVPLEGDWTDRAAQMRPSVDGLYGDIQYVKPFMLKCRMAVIHRRCFEKAPLIIGVKDGRDQAMFNKISKASEFFYRGNMGSGVSVTVDFVHRIDNIAEQSDQWRALADTTHSSDASSWRDMTIVGLRQLRKIMTFGDLEVCSLPLYSCIYLIHIF